MNGEGFGLGGGKEPAVVTSEFSAVDDLGFTASSSLISGESRNPVASFFIKVYSFRNCCSGDYDYYLYGDWDFPVGDVCALVEEYW
jgi:hypothetical protein